MDTRKLATALAKYSNALTEAGEALATDIEKIMSADGDEGKDDKKTRPSRASSKDKDDDDDGKDNDGDDPSEEDIIKVGRKALKVLDAAEVKKIAKKYGKADRVSEVEAKYRKATIDALNEAIDAAD